MSYGSSIGIHSAIGHDTDYYFGDGYNDGLARMVEVIEMEHHAYKEQNYWLEAYERAQQLGIRGHTIQEIILHLERVNKQLSAIRDYLQPNADSSMQFTGEGLRDTANNIR